MDFLQSIDTEVHMWSLLENLKINIPTASAAKEIEFTKRYAIRELDILGITKKDRLYKSVNRVLKSLLKESREDHFAIANLVASLVSLRPLTDCTHEAYKVDVSVIYKQPQGTTYQCSRCLNMLSTDGGKTWTDMNMPSEKTNCSCEDTKCACHEKQGFFKIGD